MCNGFYSTKAYDMAAKKFSKCYSSFEYQTIISSDGYKKNNHNFTLEQFFVAIYAYAVVLKLSISLIIK